MTKSESQKSQLGNTLYVMVSERAKCVKIGRTKGKVKDRANNLRVGCPDIRVVGEFPGAGNLEAAAHKALSKHRIGGEWFDAEPSHAMLVISELIDSKKKIVVHTYEEDLEFINEMLLIPGMHKKIANVVRALA